MKAAPHTLRFGDFELDVGLFELRCAGSVVALRPKPLRVLLYLLENRDRVVSKEELRDRVWPDIAVGDAAIASAFKDLRRALGDDGSQQRWVRTQRGRGYRFVGSLEIPAQRSASRSSGLGGLEWKGWRGGVPFVGREGDLRVLDDAWKSARDGVGAVIIVRGEPGIGKTRLLHELRQRVEVEHARVLLGSCYEGEWSPAYSLLIRPLSELLRKFDEGSVSDLLASDACIVGHLIPDVMASLPTLARVPLASAQEERQRLWASLSRIVIRLAERRPLLLMLDDIQWCDADTLSFLRYLARMAARAPLLLVLAYRDTCGEIGSAALQTLALLEKETECAQLSLGGLAPDEVRQLAASILVREDLVRFAEPLIGMTQGNPFFIREILFHRLELGGREDEDNVARLQNATEVWLPPGVRAALERRLVHVSAATRRMLDVGSCFCGPVSFGIALRVMELDEPSGLAALEEALEAQLIAEHAREHWSFRHDLIQQFLYAQLSLSRRLRLHRSIAEELEREGTTSGEQVARIGRQYHRSIPLPGSERGFDYCLRAAEQADAAAAHQEAVAYLDACLELIPGDDSRRLRVLTRLGTSLVWNLQTDRARSIALQAAELIAGSEGEVEAARYLATVADAMWSAARDRRTGDLAVRGLRLCGSRRDSVWARLMTHSFADAQAAAEEGPGTLIEAPEQREVSCLLLEALEEAPASRRPSLLSSGLWRYAVFDSRADVLERGAHLPQFLVFLAGELRSGLADCRERAETALQAGLTLPAAEMLVYVSTIESALGELAAAQVTCHRVLELVRSLADVSFAASMPSLPLLRIASTRGDTLDALVRPLQTLVEDPGEAGWTRAPRRAVLAYVLAMAGRAEEARLLVQANRAAIERGASWAPYYVSTVHLTCETLWNLGCRAGFDIEVHLRRKVIEPDFRTPHADGRISLARLCALEGRTEEASAWFQRAREVLDAQGARPLRALVDHDEGSMYLRRERRHDRARARTLLEHAAKQFEELGMHGWTRRAEGLLQA